MTLQSIIHSEALEDRARDIRNIYIVGQSHLNGHYAVPASSRMLQ
jgi:hypothetical protein